MDTNQAREIERQECLRDAQTAYREIEVDFDTCYGPGSLGEHELLDRAALVLSMWDQFVLNHPACLRTREWYEAADDVLGTIHEFYQRLSADILKAEEK